MYATSTPPGGKYGPDLGDTFLTYGLSAVGLLAGIALIGRGQRRRLRSRWRR